VEGQGSCNLYTYVYNVDMNTVFAKIPKTISISEFRATLAASLKRAKKAPFVILDRRGGESYVLLSIEMYNELVEVQARAQKNKSR
jgi:prevent-host-death family protein